MFAAKSYQVSRPGLKKPKPKKKKQLAGGGGALSARSGSTGSLPAYPSPRPAAAAGRQRSLTADQPRLRRAQLDSRVREAAAPPRPGRRLAPPPASQPARQPSLADRLPAGVAAAAVAGVQRSRRAEPAVRGRRAALGPARDGSSQRGSPPRARSHGAGGSTASSSDRRDRPAHGGGDPVDYSDERDYRDRQEQLGHRDQWDHRDQRDHRNRRDRRDSQDQRHYRDHRDHVDNRHWLDDSDPRDQRDYGDHQDQRDARETRDRRDQREPADRPLRRGDNRDRVEHGSDGRDLHGAHGQDQDHPEPGDHRARSGHSSPGREAAGPDGPSLPGHDRDQSERQQQSQKQSTAASSDTRQTASNPPTDPLKPLASLQIPNLNELMAGSASGGPRNLQDVINNFLWAKQQASATASAMSNLRSLMEGGAAQGVSKGQATAGDAPSDQPTPAAAEAQGRLESAGSAASLASSGGTTYLLPGDSRAQLASSSRQLADRAARQAGSEAGSALRSASEAALPAAAPPSSGLQSVQSGALQSVHSGALQSMQSGALQSVQSGALQSVQSGLPSTQSGVLQSGQSSLQSGQNISNKLTAPQDEMEVSQLRTQFQLQQAKLKQMEQKNYVLSLAVEGQEKTIRTMTNELQEAREASREPATVPAQQPPQSTLSAQSWPIQSSKTEAAAEDDLDNRREVERLNAVLETKEQELNILKAWRPATDLQAFSTGKPRNSQTITNSHQLTDQAGPGDGWRPRLDGHRTRSSELYRAAAAEPLGCEHGPLRRHSFTVPPPREDTRFTPSTACRSRLGVASTPCHPPPAGPGHTLCAAGLETHIPYSTAGRQEELRQTVEDSLSRVRQLETELAELRNNRDRDRGDHGSECGLLAGLAGPGEPAVGGRLCKPFPQIVRMTELKLQQTYQSLTAEQNKNRLLNKALHEASARQEQQAAQAERLKERLAGSVEERRQLQARLTAAETAAAAAATRQQRLSDDLQRKTELLAQASQYLDERIDQVAALSRELEETRAEAAHEVHLSAERLAQLAARVAELETLAAKQQAENRLLRQSSAEADQLAQTGRRLRQRVLELTEKLERSTATGQMLENYVLFLKASYSKMFGSGPPTPAPGPGLGPDLPASLRDLLDQAEAQ